LQSNRKESEFDSFECEAPENDELVDTKYATNTNTQSVIIKQTAPVARMTPMKAETSIVV
jgi:hypothetical protein